MTRAQFKAATRKSVVYSPIYETELSRRASILTARVRCEKSDLNVNLYNELMSDSPICAICNVPETTDHFFMKLTKYNPLRINIADHIPLECFNTSSLLHGSPRYNGSLNIAIQRFAQAFIIASARL